MLIIKVSNQLQGVTLQEISGQCFSNKNTDAIHGYGQQLVVGNSDTMRSLSTSEGNQIWKVFLDPLYGP
ncbi:MAG: hypothetical protein EZS28_046458 [Streblomastix strix]|uniref:Uncharacterized protein n=1 Tax=Streblomastix strix TaxID=222440 RepID=A0A5J4TKJ3_9EUKA|nr:MAG: hypothetical protein EZS28_046458 [Streblomastix strix]